MNLQLATACDFAAEYQGRLSILGTFDTIDANHFPFVKFTCSFVFQIGWSRHEAGPHTVTVRFMNEDGKTTLNQMESAIKVAFQEGQFFTSTNHIIHLQQLKFARSGIYLASVAVDGSHIGDTQLQVIDTTHSARQKPE